MPHRPRAPDGSLGQAAAGDGEDAGRADLALVDVQVAAVGAEPGVDGADAAAGGGGSAAEQGQRAVGGDREAGDRAGGRVHGEQELTVLGDLHPAWGHLVIGERRSRDRRQRPVPGVGERRDGAAVSAPAEAEADAGTATAANAAKPNTRAAELPRFRECGTCRDMDFICWPSSGAAGSGRRRPAAVMLSPCIRC